MSSGLIFGSWPSGVSRIALLDSVAVKPSKDKARYTKVMASRLVSFFELVIVNWHWTRGCLMTVLPVVCASHCTTMSTLAPCRLNWISSEDAPLSDEFLAASGLAAPAVSAGVAAEPGGFAAASGAGAAL